MRFDPAHQNSVPTVCAPALKNLRAHARAEAQLTRRMSNALLQLGYCRTELVWILLRSGDRYTERIRSVEQTSNVPHDPCSLRNYLEQLHLRINHEQGGILPVHELRAARKLAGFCGFFNGLVRHGAKLTPGWAR